MGEFDDLLAFHKPNAEKEAFINYWFESVYQQFKLGLPITNNYPKSWVAHKYIHEAIQLILILLQKDGKITEKTFADAKREAISKIM